MSDTIQSNERETFVTETLAVVARYPKATAPSKSQLRATVLKMDAATFEIGKLLLKALKANLEGKS